MFHSSTKNTLSKGITIVELLIVITVMGILSTILFSAFDDIYTSNYRTLGSTTQVNDTRSSLRRIQSDLSASNQFLATPSVTDPTGPSTGGNWSYAGADTTRRTLIASTLATTGTDSNRTPVYIATAGSCNTPVTSNDTLNNNLIYYVKDGKLYRRTVVADNAAIQRCSGYAPIQKQTCAAITDNTRCQGSDALLLQNVSKFEINYFSSPASTSPISSVYANPALLDDTITTVSLKIETSQKINGKDNIYSAEIRVSRR